MDKSKDVLQDAESLLGFIRQYGHTDADYLKHHFPRFAATKRLFDENWSLERGSRVLDIGAHWLHQASFFALDGYQVTAADFGATLALPEVKAYAEALDVDLLVYDDLSDGKCFRGIADSSIDVVIFTEILEHITFNPVQFWREVYRIMAPGGRIIITTPNVYSFSSRVWRFSRFLSGFGSGLEVDEILNMRTYGHHWKEYSRKEILKYFALLSQDFQANRALYINEYEHSPGAMGHFSMSRRLLARLSNRVPVVRSNLYIEMDLREKNKGITLEPGW